MYAMGQDLIFLPSSIGIGGCGWSNPIRELGRFRTANFRRRESISQWQARGVAPTIETLIEVTNKGVESRFTRSKEYGKEEGFVMSMKRHVDTELSKSAGRAKVSGLCAALQLPTHHETSHAGNLHSRCLPFGGTPCSRRP